MTPDAIPDAAVEDAWEAAGGHFPWAKGQMRDAIAAAMPRLLAERDAKWKSCLDEANRLLGIEYSKTEDLKAKAAERDARIKVLEEAAQRLTNGAFGNGSRITVSKADYDRLVSVLPLAALEKPHDR